jgi:hypothetical protein
MLAILICSGCSTFSKANKESRLDPAVPLQGSDSAEVFKRIQQAKAQNSVVLQVAGDSQPIRVLPLPTDGTPVFVSDLLRQTGIQEKMGRMMVTVHRSSAVDYAGAKMEVRFDDEGEIVRPETDYALQSGDRVKIAKDPRTSFGTLLDQILPANASRALVGQ